MPRTAARGGSVNAARCAAISTIALLGCAVAHGSLRALLAFTWVSLTVAALALEWGARRRVTNHASPTSPARQTGAARRRR